MASRGLVLLREARRRGGQAVRLEIAGDRTKGEKSRPVANYGVTGEKPNPFNGFRLSRRANLASAVGSEIRGGVLQLRLNDLPIEHVSGQPKAVPGVCGWGESHMPDSNEALERYRAQAGEMIAVAAKTPIPSVYAKPFQMVARAHGFLEAQRPNNFLTFLARRSSN